MYRYIDRSMGGWTDEWREGGMEVWMDDYVFYAFYLYCYNTRFGLRTVFRLVTVAYIHVKVQILAMAADMYQ